MKKICFGFLFSVILCLFGNASQAILVSECIRSFLEETTNTVNKSSDIININDFLPDLSGAMIDYNDIIDINLMSSDKNINISNINIYDEANIQDYDLIQGESAYNVQIGNKDNDNLKTITYTNNDKYTFKVETDESAGNKIQISSDKAAGQGGLNNAVWSAVPEGYSKTFSLTSDYKLNAELKRMQGESLTIFGNNYSIDGSKDENSGYNGISFTSSIEKTEQTLNIYDVEFKNFGSYNSADILISSTDGKVNIYRSKFTNNRSNSVAFLRNIAGVANIVDSLIDGNSSTRDSGGLILQNSNWTTAELNIVNTTFSNNKGNIYNWSSNVDDAVINIYDSKFTDNSVNRTNSSADSAGVILNIATININACNDDVIFKDNYLDGELNDINNTGKINFNANAGRKIHIGSGIMGKGTLTKNGKGVLELGGKNDEFKGTLNVNEGSLNILADSTYFNSSAVTTFADKSKLDLRNGILDNFNFGGGVVNLPSGGSVNIGIDVDLANIASDKININQGTVNGANIKISNINLLSDSEADEVKINGVFGDDIKNSVISSSGTISLDSSAKTYYGPIYKYIADYYIDENSLEDTLVFNRGNNSNGTVNYDGLNPAIMAGPIGAISGAYLTQLNSYEDAFANMDSHMLMNSKTRNTLKMQNRFANASDSSIAFLPDELPEKNRGLWFRPYASFEKVRLKNGPKTGNNMYGSFFGGDSGIIELKNGWDAVYSGYAAYTGSHQHYDGIGIYQDGGLLGATGTFYKGNFFSGITANIGASAGEASTMYGKDNFTMLNTGIASKTGYNWELLDGKVILQPNYLMSYSFINTFDYHTASGVSVNSDPLHAIQIMPGVKFIGNLKNGWQPYASVSVVWNIMDNTRFKANDVSLPQLSINPYVQYGVGLQKKWGERFTGYGQTMIRNGGRDGISLGFGFRWSLGK